MRKLFRMLFLGLVLVTIALVSALTTMRFAIHGREVTVPKLAGMTPNEAERAAASQGLQVVIERQYYSPDVAEGRITAQTPLPDVRVRRGWSIRVAQSLGPQRVAIPDVTGTSQRVAELNIRRRGLDIGSIAQINLVDTVADRVLAQNPPANASGVASPKINLLISAGPAPAEFVMPSFIGQPLGSATLALQDAGMKLSRATMSSQDAAPAAQGVVAPPLVPNATSVIVSQSPVAGQKITAGSAVSFEVR